MKKKINFKVRQYYAAAYNGDNGDLIVGRVLSVRTNGLIVLINLLSGKTSTKKAEVLRRRNKRVSKAQADKLVAVYKHTKNRATVRRLAVALEPYSNEKTISLQQALKPGRSKKEIDALINKLIKEFVENLTDFIMAKGP